MTNPENPFDRAEEKREQSRDSSFSNTRKENIIKKLLRQLRKEEKAIRREE